MDFGFIPVSTKKYNHNMKVELFHLVGMLRSLSPGDSISVALRKLLLGGRRGSQVIYKFVTGSSQPEHKRSDIKLRNLVFYVWEDARLWTHWIHSSHIHPNSLGSVPFTCSFCFLHPPSSSAITMEGGGIHWIAVLGALIHIWRPEINDGCDITCLSTWQEIFSFHIGYFLTGCVWHEWTKINEWKLIECF